MFSDFMLLRGPVFLQEYPWKWDQVGERRFWHLCFACHQAAWPRLAMVVAHAALQGAGLLQIATFIADGRWANRHCKPRGDHCNRPRLQVGTVYLTQAPPELAARLLNSYLFKMLTKHVQIYLCVLSFESCLQHLLPHDTLLPRPAMGRRGRLSSPA